MTELLHRELTGKIIGVYYKVYNELSRTYPEFIYENAMMQELRRQGIRCTRQDEHQILYKGQLIGTQRLDIFVAEEVVVEIKVKPRMSRLDQAQLMSYLKTTERQVGLLFNFGSPEPEFKRAYFEPMETQPAPDDPEEVWPDLLFPDLSYQVIGGLFEVHNELGPGYIHRIYANACHRELQQRGLEVKSRSEMTVFYRGEPVGQIKLGHLEVRGEVMVFPVAVRGEEQIELENLRRWMASQGVQLGILANLRAERLEPKFMKELEHGSLGSTDRR